MPRLSRRQRWEGLDVQQTLNVIADDLDEIDDDNEAQKTRVTQLKVMAGALLVSVCTAVLVTFATGLLK